MSWFNQYFAINIGGAFFLIILATGLVPYGLLVSVLMLVPTTPVVVIRINLSTVAILVTITKGMSS